MTSGSLKYEESNDVHQLRGWMADPLQNAALAWGFPTGQALNVAKQQHGWKAAPWVSQHQGVHLTHPSSLKRSLALGYQQHYPSCPDEHMCKTSTQATPADN